jgi:hypothetical protein
VCWDSVCGARKIFAKTVVNSFQSGTKENAPENKKRAPEGALFVGMIREVRTI